jgi:hypothetical protein
VLKQFIHHLCLFLRYAQEPCGTAPDAERIHLPDGWSIAKGYREYDADVVLYSLILTRTVRGKTTREYIQPITPQDCPWTICVN